jgi:S-DNA-T family DNA segregation ATPase FtsK/SpoIIIE
MAAVVRSNNASTRRLASPAVRSLMRQRTGEFTGIVLGLVGLALLVALVSHNPADPSLNTATTRGTSNLAGPPGAVLSDLLLQGFGLAGALPGLAMLAWCWRIASHRGIGSPAVRILALLTAMPMLGTVLAALPGPGPQSTIPWPTVAGPGGAIGQLLAEAVGHTGHSLLGAWGPVVLWPIGLVAALGLTVLTLGLSFGEWRTIGSVAGRTAGTAARHSVSGGQSAVGIVGRLSYGLAGLVSPLAGVFRRGDQADEPPPRRAEPVLRTAPAGSTTGMIARLTTPEIVNEPPPPAPELRNRLASMLEKRPAKAAAKPKPEQIPLPLTEGGWRFPPLSLLTPAPARGAVGPTAEALEIVARRLETVLGDYGVQGTIVAYRAGPVVTLYELEPAPGIRSARVIGLADDIARTLAVAAVRIATVSGRNVIGIEVPHEKRETVYLSEVLAAEAAQKHNGKLSLALGKDIGGEAVVADLARMPHLMIAGTTGSGKSVGVNAMILSLLYRLSPEQCRLILIDPKMLELSVYEGIPHLMAPVVTEPAKAVTALKWTVREMERRYRSMSLLGVRNIGGYNDRVADARAKGEVVTRRVQTGFDPDTGRPTFEEQPLALEALPFIVVVVDEMADLMMVAGKEIEAAVQRLAQMARAAGIHVIMATQRPSVDVITGTIKANFPTRISFQVISKFDSRTILGEQGAEQLLGMGDMLHMMGGGRITRVHGPFVSDREVEDVVAFLREQGEPAYVEEVTEHVEDDGGNQALSGIAAASDGEKGLFDQAVAVVAREGKASTSFIQRHLNIGYNRAAKLIEQMEKEGIVSAANHVGKREILIRRTHDDDN